MTLIELLLTGLGLPVAKFLIKNYLGDAAAVAGEGLIDIAKKKIETAAEQRQAARLFEDIGDKIAKRLLPLFEAEGEEGISIEAVIRELSETLEGNISAKFFLNKELDPTSLTKELHRIRPLPKGQMSSKETAFYERALAEAVRYIVETAAELPEFHKEFAAVSLQRLSRIGEDVEEILGTVQRIERRVSISDVKDENKRYEADYRQAVIRNLDYVELFGADIAPESKRHSLSVAYVSLNLESPTAKGEESESLPVETVLNSLYSGSGRLLIRGEAGSGKSTLFRWAAIEAAKAQKLGMLEHARWPTDLDLSKLFGVVRPDKTFKAVESTTEFRIKEEHLIDLGSFQWHSSKLDSLLLKKDIWALTYGELPKFSWKLPYIELSEALRRFNSNWREHIPFLIRLRDCTAGKLPTPENFPVMIAKELGSPPAQWVTSVLREGRGLVLFDGVDEIPNLHRDTVRNEMQAIVDTYPDNHFLVSTRPAAVPEDWLAGLGFQEALVNPMSESDKVQFIDNWHEAVGRELARQGKPGDLTGVAQELKEKLPENPSVSRLAANPLLCAMVCALHRDREQKLPENQSALCEALCEMLLHRRERESQLDLSAFPEVYRTLSYEQKRAIVQEIAHFMVRNGYATITRKQAEDKVATTLKGFPGRSSSDAPIICRGLVERSGMLREARPGSIDFIHNTFKEYLAADRFVEEDDAGLLAKRALDPAWQPVVLFAAGTRIRNFPSELIRKIINFKLTDQKEDRTATDDPLRARKLVALQCRAAALHLDPELDKKVAAIEAQVFPPRTMADAEALASGGDAVVRFLGYDEKLHAREAAACVRTLRLIGTIRAQQSLETYLKDRRKTVVSELAQAIDPLHIPAVQDMLRDGQRVPRGIARQISDLSPLAKLSGIQKLDLSGTRVSDLSPLAKLSRIQNLVLSRTQVSDLSPLAKLSRLQNLDLTHTQVSDLIPLAKLSGLQYLELSGTKVTDLSPLAKLSGLQELHLSGTQVSDLSPLAKLSGLQNLYLLRAQVSDLSPLAKLSRLQNLYLSGTDVSDLRPLAKLSRLQYLDLSDTQVSDLSPLAKLSGIQELDLSGTLVSDLSPLAKLSRIQDLSLWRTQVSDLSPLAKLSRIQNLGLWRTQVSDLSPLAKLSGIQELDLSGTLVSDLNPLAKLSRLQYLELSGTQVSDLSPLAKLSGLQYLEFSGTQVSDLSPLAKLSRLQYLELSGTKVTDLSPLAKLPNLKLLSITNTQVRDVGPLRDHIPHIIMDQELTKPGS